MGWVEFGAAFVAFFLSHSIPVQPPVRTVLVRHLGSRGFTLAYSAMSLAILAWLIVAAGRAPYVSLWAWAPWQNHIAMAVMLAVCLFLAFAIATPNPFSFGGSHNERFDPDNPGILRFLRHPLLVVLGLWAFAHVLPNGNLAHVILFVVFAAFALLGQKIIDRRKQWQMGDDWDRLWAQTCEARIALPRQSLIRLMLALGIYGVSLWLHPVLLGVSPLP
ncbi:MAG: NnrU family protein [Paracoccaceae bacterium]|nr:NnrU family protein [Paracoccaceae bacterium]